MNAHRREIEWLERRSADALRALQRLTVTQLDDVELVHDRRGRHESGRVLFLLQKTDRKSSSLAP